MVHFRHAEATECWERLLHNCERLDIHKGGGGKCEMSQLAAAGIPSPFSRLHPLFFCGKAGSALCIAP